MKYINKEYGFAFRPPFFDKFYEQSDDGPPIGRDNFPGKCIMGVGYDYRAINGAMLIGKHGSMWGVRVLYYSGKKWLDNDDFVRHMGSSCANTADGSFAHFNSGPLSIKWARHNDRSLVLQVSSKRKLRVRVIFYPCYDCPGELSIEGAVVHGRSPYMAVVPGTVELTDNNAVYRGRYLVEDDSRREYFHAVSYMPPSDSANGAFNEAIMEFVINRRQPSVYVYASVGDHDIFDAELPRFDRIQNLIETTELRYGVNKTMGSGQLGEPAERMINAVLWSRVYYPYLLTEIFTPKRTVLDNHFDMDGTDENCSAILGCYTGTEQAVDQLSYTQEDKIMAVFAVWHNYKHITDRAKLYKEYLKLASLYPPVATPVVAEKSKNDVAYKWSDSPLKEKFNPTAMFSLDLSSLKLLAFDVLERIAAMFDLADDKAKYAKAKNEMKKIINETFWCEGEGLYINRYTTGQWASAIGATSFYPLLAGAVDSREKLSLIVNNLTDTNRFWGDYVIPTLSIDNREYGKRSKPDNNGKRTPPYLEYRGSIVPYVNFLVYHGLKRYGLDEIAAQIAQKSAALWSANETDNVENYSVYLPKGKRVQDDEYLSANGNMLALIGMQELIDIEYFRPDLKDAISFGTFVQGPNSVTNIKLLDRLYSIEVTDESTALIMDDINMFKGDGGKFIVRNFVMDGDGGGEFMIDAKQNITVNLNLPSSDKKTVKYFFIVPAGKSAVKAIGGMVNITKIE
ncbi:MAG: hypothetical protein K2J01_06930 [Clostridiales bacterium]|nr:hypothetical protein [Clostridiales bacterium]